MQIQYLRLLIMVYYILCIFIKTFTIIIVKINQEWSRWEKKLGISNREISGEFKEQPMIDYQYVDNRRRLYAGCKYDNCKQHSS